MKFKLFIFLAVIVFAVSSCNDSDDDTEQTPSVSEPEASEIQEDLSTGLEDLSTGLKGKDADANGIRDDIDKLISQKFSYTPEVKRGAEQKAFALQKFMEATTKEDAMRAAEEISRSTSCISKLLSDPVNDYEKRQMLSKELEAWTANTRERLSKYFESNKLIGGTYFTQPVEPVCD